jgi:autotransporter-associated beta strand protein
VLSGVISGSGDVTSNGAGTLVLSGNNSYTGITTIGAGTLVLRNNNPNVTTSDFTGTGALVIEPLGTSFGGALVTGNVFGAGLSGLTLGKSGNTRDITVGATTSIAGPINIYGGNIYLNADLTSAQSGAAILLKASGNIVQAETTPSAVSTQGGAITYWADSDADHVGAIRLQPDASVTSNGGNVFFGGGLVLATGYAATDGGSGYGNGVELSAGASVSAGSGNVTLRGKGYDTTNYSDGVRINGAGASVSGSNITLVGQGSSVGGANNRGVTIEGDASVTGSGTVSITGVGGATADGSHTGVYLSGANTVVEATASSSRCSALPNAGAVLPLTPVTPTAAYWSPVNAVLVLAIGLPSALARMAL